MNYIVFDLEWNQPMDEMTTVTEPFYFPGEIIEIGAVKLDDDFRAVDELRLYIKPVFYPRLHKKIISLTKIRDADLQDALPFPEAYAQFIAWCGEEYTFMTWSLSDLPVLADNLFIHGMDASEFPVCCDLQRIFGREIMRAERRCSLEHAMEILNESGEAAHDALHDARNTVKVCGYLDLAEYLGEYSAKLFTEPPQRERYENARAMLADPALSRFACPWCGAETVCEPWVPFVSGHAAYARCPEEEDEFLVQVFPERERYGKCRARRFFFEMSDDLWELYQDRKSRQN